MQGFSGPHKTSCVTGTVLPSSFPPVQTRSNGVRHGPKIQKVWLHTNSLKAMGGRRGVWGVRGWEREAICPLWAPTALTLALVITP